MNLSTAQRTAWRAAHPAEYARLKAYWAWKDKQEGKAPYQSSGGGGGGYRKSYSKSYSKYYRSLQPPLLQQRLRWELWGWGWPAWRYAR